MGNIIVKSFDARRLMLQGLLEAVGVVVDTFGPNGKPIAFQKGTNVILSKDGITALKNIVLSDELKDMGVKFVREASDKANYHNGDGSSTTAILTGAFCVALNELIDRGMDINLIRESVKEMRDFFFEQLPQYKCDIDDEEQIRNIAYVSSNGDTELADLVVEAFTSIGDKGLVSYADSQSRYGESFVKTKKGCELKKGYISSKCVNSPNDQCIMEDVSVAIFRDPVEDVDSFKLFIQLMHKHNLLVIAPDYSQEVQAFFVNTASKDNNVFIRTPGYSVESIQRENEDLAVIFNTKIIGEDMELGEANWETCGHADSIIVSKNSCIVSGPSTDAQRQAEYIQLLEDLINHQDPTHALTDNEIKNVKERIAQIDGGIATIYVGALSNQELSERKDRVDDAVNAVRNALSSGFVVGGGTVLYRIANSKEFEKLYKKASADKKMVYNAFARAVETPLKLLVKSAGQTSENVVIKLAKNKKYGFNARTGEVEDLIKKGIVDPYSIVKNSLLYSSNMATQFVSIADALISDVKNLSIQALDDVVDPGRGVFSDLM